MAVLDVATFWDHVTHDQPGAEGVGKVFSLPQSFVRCGGEIRAYQDWSMELYGYATSFCRSIRGFLVVNPDWCEGYGNTSIRDFLSPGEMFMTTCARLSWPGCVRPHA